MTHNQPTAQMDSPRRLIDRAPSVRQFVIGVFVLLLTGGLVWGAWWWRHPTVFDPAATSWSVGGGEKRPADGAELHIGMTLPSLDRSGSVSLIKAEPHVLTNTADATITFHICVAKAEDVIFSVTGDLSGWCSELTEVDGAELPLSNASPRHQVIMTVSSTHVGELRVQGMDLTYRNGLQEGTQRVGQYVWLRYT